MTDAREDTKTLGFGESLTVKTSSESSDCKYPSRLVKTTSPHSAQRDLIIPSKWLLQFSEGGFSPIVPNRRTNASCEVLSGELPQTWPDMHTTVTTSSTSCSRRT